MNMSLIPIQEVAKRYGKTVPQVRYAIKQQRLSGTKNGWCWFCEESSLPELWPDKKKLSKEEVTSE